VEGAGTLARRAAAARAGTLIPKASRRFGAEALAAMSRVNARQTALEVASDAIRWVVGAGGGDAGALGEQVSLPAIHAAQSGLVADMDEVADHVYGRR
ncbi:MAG: acyl-CoA dehydrogenase family protein, partial [Solirubrobacteraceae bacterium]